MCAGLGMVQPLSFLLSLPPSFFPFPCFFEIAYCYAAFADLISTHYAAQAGLKPSAFYSISIAGTKQHKDRPEDSQSKNDNV